MNYSVAYALAVSGNDLYVGGMFKTAGGSPATNIAKWDGSSWSALGSGISTPPNLYASVSALAVSSGNVFAGGQFTRAGGIAATNVAQWNGSSWSALGSGMDSDVNALAASGNDLYVGGTFSTAGNVAANRIARWNGSSWSALGSGIGRSTDIFVSVSALAVSGADVYAGGFFTTAGGIAATDVAKWNGSNWSALGSGLGRSADFQVNSVWALEVSGADLYAAGEFTNAGGIAANYIARWDGTNWSVLGSEINGPVSAPAVSGNDLFVGGEFTTAGGKVSAYVARAYLLELPTLSVRRSGTDVMVSWPSADTTGFALEQAGVLSSPASWVENTAPVTDDDVKKSVTVPATNGLQFFRLRRP